MDKGELQQLAAQTTDRVLGVITDRVGFNELWDETAKSYRQSIHKEIDNHIFLALRAVNDAQ
jgi:hypothetical protein